MKDLSPFEKRLRILKTEMECDVPGIVEALEKGLKVILITEPYSDSDLDPDSLRRIGGLVMLCKRYGAAVVFVNEHEFAELNSKTPTKP